MSPEDLTTAQLSSLAVLVSSPADLLPVEVYEQRVGGVLDRAARRAVGRGAAIPLHELVDLGLAARVYDGGRAARYRATPAGHETAQRAAETGATGRSTGPRKRSAWTGDGTLQRTPAELDKLAEAAGWLNRLHRPGIDPEPQYSAELVDRDGTVWRTDRHRPGSGWVPEGCPELALRWTSPALAEAGPFMGPPRRTEQQIAADKRSAARARWAARVN